MLKFGIILTLILVLVLGSVFLIIEGIRVNQAEKAQAERGGNPPPQKAKSHRGFFSFQRQSTISANDALAKSTLRTLSTASETYAAANTGYYPMGIDVLTEAVPPYLNRLYCGETINGYSYECEMWDQGYTFKAVPEEIGTSGTAVWVITTGGIMTDYPDRISSGQPQGQSHQGMEEMAQRIEEPRAEYFADVRYEIEAEDYSNYLSTKTGAWYEVNGRTHLFMDGPYTGQEAVNTFEYADGNYMEVVADQDIGDIAPTSPHYHGPYLEYNIYIDKPGQYQLGVKWGGGDAYSDSFYAYFLKPDKTLLATKRLKYFMFHGRTRAWQWDGWGLANRITSAYAGYPDRAIWVFKETGTYTLRFAMREKGTAVDALTLERIAE